LNFFVKRHKKRLTFILKSSLISEHQT